MGSFSLRHWIILGLIVLFFWWRSTKKKSVKNPVGGLPTGLASTAPAFNWPELGEYEAEVVGESHAQRELAAIAGRHGDDAAQVQTTALLVPYDSPYDSQAVRVEIAGNVVGHLSRDAAREYRERLEKKGFAGAPAACGALVMGGYTQQDGSRASYGVQLDITPFD